jgi:hypothetical protein
MNNVQLLIQAGLILSSNLPSPDDQTTINNLSQAEVKGLIDIYNNLGAAFLERNCNVSSVVPGAGRTLGIVF